MTKKEGYRTPNYTLPITLFELLKTETIENNNLYLVETTGIEPMSKSFV